MNGLRTLSRPGAASPAPHPSAPPQPVGASRTGEPFGTTLDPRFLGRTARVFAVVLAALGLGHLLFVLVPGVQYLQVFDLAREQTFGTWVTSAVHLLSAALAGACALLARAQGSRWARNWLLLTVVLALLSADETAGLHDRLVVPLRDRFDTSGALLYPWVAVAGVLGAAFLLVQLRFLRGLGRPTGRDLVLAGVVFVAGAAGMEMLEGLVASPGGAGADSLLYAGLVLVEELMELGASMWVVVILLRHLMTWLGRPRLVVAPSGGSDRAAPRGRRVKD